MSGPQSQVIEKPNDVIDITRGELQSLFDQIEQLLEKCSKITAMNKQLLESARK